MTRRTDSNGGIEPEVVVDVRRIRGGAFDLYFELLVEGQVIATLFYDDRPESMHTQVPLPEKGGPVYVVGREESERSLNEDPPGWSLYFTARPQVVHDVGAPEDSVEFALDLACTALT
jgi:hypothetical protein